MQNFPATEYVRSLQSGGSKYGLSRTRRLLNQLSSPDDKLKIIHVAGTNGKGSVCAYITNILLAAGKTAGTFTSPAVFCYEEQFLVNGVSSAALTEKYLALTLAAAQNMDDAPTAFEIETCAALAMFAGEGCAYAVVECGLGGLNDSTNAINKKQIAVINSISLEHTAILGGTVTEIAAQKAGIIKNCTAVANALQPPEVLRYFNEIGCVIAPSPQIITADINGCEFIAEGEKYAVKMHGTQQAYNAATAAKACELIGIDKSYIRQGLEKTVLDGRVQVIKSGRTYILDGAHNPSGFAPLAEFISSNYSGSSLTIIYGCLSDKDTSGCAKMLSHLNAEVIIVTPRSYRAKQPAQTYAEISSCFKNVTVAQNLSGALESSAGEVVAVCGTFTILKEAKQWIKKRQ